MFNLLYSSLCPLHRLFFHWTTLEEFNPVSFVFTIRYLCTLILFICKAKVNRTMGTVNYPPRVQQHRMLI